MFTHTNTLLTTDDCVSVTFNTSSSLKLVSRQNIETLSCLFSWKSNVRKGAVTQKYLIYSL